MKFKLIPAGEFMMGSPEDEEDRDSDETQHRVRITKPFYLGVCEVQVGEFRAFADATDYETEAEKAGWAFDATRFAVLRDVDKNKDRVAKWKEENASLNLSTVPKNERDRTRVLANRGMSWRNPGFSQSDEHPVVHVSWDDAVAYCNWLRKKDGLEYCLPTEAQWEYACRAESKARFCYGDHESGLTSVGNVADTTANEKLKRLWALPTSDGYAFTAPVGKYKPNGWGLYGMHGNVWEWCADLYNEDYYEESPTDDPPGPSSGSYRVLRGGSFFDYAGYCRSANRADRPPGSRSFSLGFRIALVPSEQANKTSPAAEVD